MSKTDSWVTLNLDDDSPIKTWTHWAISILQPLVGILSTKVRRTTPLRSTSYLDGLRGFAALLVYFLHNQGWAHDALKLNSIFENAFGFDRQYYFAALPGIRLFFSGGHLSVAVFFVVSGYALACKPMSLIHKGELNKLGDNLASSLFRRWTRLYIPVITTTFVYMALNFFIRGLSVHKPEKTFFAEAYRWYCELKDFSFLFRIGGEPWFTFNGHIWTIPLELKGSIAVYTSLLVMSRCTRNARLWYQVALIYYFLYIADGWYLALFTTGMLLADLDLLAKADDLPNFMVRLEPYKDMIFMTLFICGIYLGGVPSFSTDIQVLRRSPGWYYLSFLVPQAVFMFKAFYLYWAGTFIVASVPQIPWLKAFFELPFNQYLGRISYAFYLVHGPILWTIGDRIYAAVGWAREAHAINISSTWAGIFRLPKTGPLGLEFSFIAAQLVILPLTLRVAEIAYYAFDEPSIRISRWAYEKVLKQSEEPQKAELPT